MGVGKIIKLQGTLYTPAKKESVGLKIPCHVCGKEIKESGLEKHVADTHPSSTESFKCNKCDFETHNLINLRHHKKRHLNKLKICPLCSKQIKYLNCHLARGNCFEKTSKPSIPCDQCDKMFCDIYKLKRHVLGVHLKVKDILCDLCNYRTYDSFNLKIHKSKMHSKESLDVVCEVCNQKTMSIEYHMKTYHFEIYSEKRNPTVLNPLQESQNQDLAPPGFL